LISLGCQLKYGDELLPPCKKCNGIGYAKVETEELCSPCFGTGFTPPPIHKKRKGLRHG